MTRSLTSALGLLMAFGVLLAGPATVPALTPVPEPTGEILFANGGRIVSIKADGTDRTVLTRKNAWVGQPWGLSDGGPVTSPDGERILFGRYYDGFKDGVVDGLMVMDRDGKNLRRLYEPPPGHEVWAGVWAPDGNRIFTLEFHDRTNPKGDYTATVRLISMATDGSDRQVILTSTFEYREKDESVSGEKMVPVGVLASPDGELLIESMNFVEDQPHQLEWVNSDTGQRTLFEKDAGSASFSPDGSQVVFTSDRDRMNVTCWEGRCSGDPQLFVKEVGSGAVTRLLPGRPVASEWAPDWSPDGKRIAFQSTRSPGSSYVGAEIWTVAPDGSCLRRLTNGAPSSDDPEWVPGGTAEACFDLNPAPLAEVSIGRWAQGQEPAKLWAGPSFKGLLLGYSFLDGQQLILDYEDCGENSGDCPAPVAIRSGPVCSRNLSFDLIGGWYLGMERRRGGLIVRAARTDDVVGSTFYAGAVETRIATPRKDGGRDVGFGYHREVVAALRPVFRNGPLKGRPGEIVLPWNTVRKARVMVKAFDRTGSLKKAARQARIFKERYAIGVAYRKRGARAWLRFGRDLKKLGKFKSVKCGRLTNQPGTISVRSTDYRSFVE